MKRVFLVAAAVIIAAVAVTLRARRARARGLSEFPPLRFEAPPREKLLESMDPLASLAAVERSVSESAVAGTPSAIPAVPSIPASMPVRAGLWLAGPD
jgi:hypothetical protein